MANKAHVDKVKRLTVLFVDDTSYILSSYKDIMDVFFVKQTDAHYARTVEEALEAISAISYDYIILDSMGGGWRNVIGMAKDISPNTKIIANSGDIEICEQMEKHGALIAEKDFKVISKLLGLE